MATSLEYRILPLPVYDQGAVDADGISGAARLQGLINALPYHGTRRYGYGELGVILRGTELAMRGPPKPCVILHTALAVFCGWGARTSSAVGSAREIMGIVSVENSWFWV